MKPASIWRNIKSFLYFSPLLIFLIFLVLWPIIQIWYFSISEYGLMNTILLINPGSYVFDSLIFTIQVAGVTTILSVVIGYLIALFLIVRKRYIQVVVNLIRIPLFVPFIVIGFIWRAVMIPKGYGTMILNTIIQLFGYEGNVKLLGTGWAINIAHIWLYIPIAFVISYAALLSVDPDLVDAARNLGASMRHVLAKIYLPLTWRALVTSASIIFLASFVGVSIPLIIGSRITYFPVLIFYTITQKFDLAEAAALSSIFIIVSIFLGFLTYILSVRFGIGGRSYEGREA